MPSFDTALDIGRVSSGICLPGGLNPPSGHEHVSARGVRPGLHSLQAQAG